MGTMISPVKGRVSSEWSKRRKNPATGKWSSHAGIDIAAPVGTDVHAAFGGKVISCRHNSYDGDPYLWLGLKSGNHVWIENSDGATQYYGHLSEVFVREGDTVAQGQKIGEVGQTGRVTGPHLHFETMSTDDLGSHFNPRILFERYELKPGSAPKVGGVKPVGKPDKPKPNEHKNSKSDNIAIQKALTAMGLDVGYPDGVDGAKQKDGVRAFQKQHGLVQDENWGPRTQEVYDHNKRLQRALNKMKSTTPKLKVDGWIGGPTIKRKNDILKRNQWTEKNLLSNLKKVGAW